ncbi:MAG TPA: glycoside hydrolase family 97 protein [Pyrinomonadaceae bacterium]|jgi:alpha-glucosidase|nr:glycoside hydrolase family 97 protein [Pyrinomonadaceae bacterium]
MKRAFLASVFVLVCGAPNPAHAQAGRFLQSVPSPDGNVVVTFSLDASGAPAYAVKYKGRTVVEPSALGLELKQGGPLSRDLEPGAATSRLHVSTYALAVGKARAARDRYRELEITLRERAGMRRTLQLSFRAYDDGAAFRYRVPAQPGLERLDVVEERSEFRFPADYRCWAMRLKTFHSNYEQEFEPTGVSGIKPGAITGLPVTIETGDGGPTLAIAEADLEDYAGMYLQGVEGSPNALVSRLSPHANGDGLAVSGRAPLSSPWRVLMIGDTPGRLIESTLILSLNDPPAFKDTSWIRPGKAAWDWWSGQLAEGVANPGMNDATMKHYVDFAAEFKLEYMLVDAGWYTPVAWGDKADLKADITKTVPEIDLPGLVSYARERGVGIILWLHWVPTRDQMDRAFPYYERLGVKGVKIDFMDRDDQEMVAFYHRVLKKAAEHHLVVDLHGAYKPTGLVRTYPNYLSQEGVLGAEYNKWSARVTATHNVTLAFTRMLAGPLDYTPAGFRNVTPAEFKPRDKGPLVMTTRAHQLAMYVVYESPLQMVADTPSAYRGQPGSEFVSLVPTSWDETRVLAGEIGKYVVIARRRGRAWFVGAMNNEEARTLRVPLNFLGRGPHTLDAFADGADAARDPKQLSGSTSTVRARETLTLRLAPSGGYAARLRPGGRGRF